MPTIDSNTHSSISKIDDIRGIVQFVLENIGQISEEEIAKAKSKHQFQPVLAEIFDILCFKYSTTIKTKEEMVKYTLRKVLKSSKNSIKSQAKLDSKSASNTLCKRYFSSLHGDSDNEDEEP